MKVTVLDSNVGAWIEPRVKPDRTDGPHISSLVLGMLKQINPNKYGAWGKDRGRDALYEIGFLWEDALAAALGPRVTLETHVTPLPQGELARDGIYGTPDRVLRDTQASRFIVEEYKATWLSGRDVFVDGQPTDQLESPKFIYWILQAKSYCAMLHGWPDAYAFTTTREQPPIARIRALFLNGTYRGDLALPGCWQLEWAPEELELWWERLVESAHAKQRTEPTDV